MRAACVLLAGLVLATADSLGPYNIDPSKTTVSGLSAGAFFATQMQVAYSAEIEGACILAGGPFFCAEGSESTAITTCMNPLISKPNPARLATLTKTAATEGKIDPVSNLAADKVWVYSGAFDTVVKRPVVTALLEYESMFVQQSAGGNVSSSLMVPSEHCFPTLDFGEKCSSLGSPYLGKCDFDGAGICLRTIYSDLKAAGSAVSANLMSFDQTKFASGHSLGDTGYIYVPTACQNNATCSLHVSFHGCQQTIADIGTEYATETGLNDYAETNNIIILYPQVKKSELIPSNPEGCFDWWGYAGSDYAYKTGAQMKFTHDVMMAVQGKSSSPDSVQTASLE